MPALRVVCKEFGAKEGFDAFTERESGSRLLHIGRRRVGLRLCAGEQTIREGLEWIGGVAHRS